MRILLYRWKVFNQDDVRDAIEYFGHQVTDDTETVIDKDDERIWRRWKRFKGRACASAGEL